MSSSANSINERYSFSLFVSSAIFAKFSTSTLLFMTPLFLRTKSFFMRTLGSIGAYGLGFYAGLLDLVCTWPIIK